MTKPTLAVLTDTNNRGKETDMTLHLRSNTRRSIHQNQSNSSSSSSSSSNTNSNSTKTRYTNSMGAPSKSESTGASTTKENNGKSIRERRWRIILLGMIILTVVYLLVSRVYYKKFGSYFSSTNNVAPGGVYKKASHGEIIELYWTLIGVSISHGALQVPRGGPDRYGKVQATFCEIDWTKQQENPSTVALFRDLQFSSSKCTATKTVATDLYQLVQDAKAFDGFDEDNNQKGNNGVVFPPNGVVFHETRCGSTLFANLLTGFSPERSRVFSESPPPSTVFQACSFGNKCDEGLHRALIRDTFYMMGRRPPSKNKEDPNYLFFKIQSIGTMYIDKFTMAFPEVPWAFVYRDTVEILQSHLKQGTRTTPKVCSRTRGLSPTMQPPTTMQIIKEAGKTLRDLTLIEYCAAHLAGLSLSAVLEHDRSSSDSANSKSDDLPGGRFVGYHQMPDIVWNEILPNHFGVNPLPPDAIANMQETAGVYSKGRGIKANQEWSEDTTIKHDTATPEVIEAANLFASKVYKRMTELSSSSS